MGIKARETNSKMFVGPKLSADQALSIASTAWLLAGRDKTRFVRIMKTLQSAHCYRLREAQPSVDKSRAFEMMAEDAVALFRYRFTISQLAELADKLGLPEDGVVTEERDRVPRVEALAMVCRRLSENAKLVTLAGEFGRSTGAFSRVVKATVAILYENHRDILYFNDRIVRVRIDRYCDVIHLEGAPLRSCWAFIDGTKQFVARPTPRQDAVSPHENLQRSIFNGHPRRHCFNWQSVQAPDGIIVSLYGPVEGRRHDTTVLNESGLLELMEQDKTGMFCGRLIYGDPAYGSSTFVTSASVYAHPKCAQFNSQMSSVRECVEWGFGRVKTLWEFMNWDKKQRVRQAPVGKNFFTAVLLLNCHTCMQPLGNQISMYLGLLPPTLDEYLNLV